MEINKKSSKVYFQMLSFLYSTIVEIMIVGILFVYLKVDSTKIDMESHSAKAFIYLVPVMIIFFFIINKLLYSFKIKSLKEKTDLKMKMIVYREIVIARLAFFVSPVFLSFAAVSRSNNINFLIYAGLMLILLLIKRPSKKSVIDVLGLDEQEILILQDPDSIIV